jgi:hypothetical protein
MTKTRDKTAPSEAHGAPNHYQEKEDLDSAARQAPDGKPRKRRRGFTLNPLRN